MPEFLDYQEQNQVFEEVIGGTGEDVLLSTGEGTRPLPRRRRHCQHVHVSRRSAGPRSHIHNGRCRSERATRLRDGRQVVVETVRRDPKILGQTFILNGAPATLIGIMPRRFTKLAADLWRPVPPGSR